MHFPVIFHLGSLSIEAHLVCEILAYSLGYQYYRYLRRQQGDIINNNNRLLVIIGGILGAAFLSKALGCLEHPELLIFSKENIAYIAASKTIVGGLLGAVIGVEVTKKLVGISRSTGDLFCFPVILGMMIGRVGCFLEGVDDGTWGNPTRFIFGMDGGDGISRHPTPLYEIAVLGCIGIFLWNLKRHVALKEGNLFKIFMVFYLAWRLSVEFIKPVHLIEPLGLSAIQLACVMGLGYYWRVIFQPRSLTIRK